MAGLSVIEHAMLAANLDEHGFSKEFGSDFYVFTMRLLKSKVHTLLKKDDFTWFQEIFSWPNDRRMKAQRVIEDTLKKIIIKPVSKVLLRWKSSDNVKWIFLTPNRKMVGIIYEDGKIRIIDTDDKRVIFEGDKVDGISFISSNEKRVGAVYKDEEKIMDVEDGMVIFTFKDDISCLTSFGSNVKRTAVSYKDGEWKIIDLVTFSPEQLLLEDKDDAKRVWHFFEPGLQQILQEPYLHEVGFP